MLQRILEQAFDTLSALFVSVMPDGTVPVLSLRLCTQADMAALCIGGLSAINEDDDEWLLTYRIPLKSPAAIL